MLGAVMPKSVAWFERLAYLSLVVGAASLALHWTLVQSTFGEHSYLYPISAVITLLVQVMLIWLTARRRTNWARWMWIVLSFSTSGFALYGAVVGTDHGVDPDAIAALARYAMYGIAFVSAAMLLMPDARAWFSTAPPPE